ncbi:MAG: hypothetical protein ACLFVH_13205 [Phycisphaerae bacterium]
MCDEPLFCPRCRCCSSQWEPCDRCGGEGTTDPGELYAEDPLWYSPDDFADCPACGGSGGHQVCLGNCDEHGIHQRKEKTHG